MERDLDGKVPCRSKSEYPETLAIAKTNEAKRPVSYDPGTQQRGGVDVGKSIGDGDGKCSGNGRTFGISPVDGTPGEIGRVTQIFASFLAINAIAISAMQPRDPHVIADHVICYVTAQFFNGPNDLVPGNNRILCTRQFAFNDV
jgi:preprotein translocase subunit SecG